MHQQNAGMQVIQQFSAFGAEMFFDFMAMGGIFD